MKDINDLYRDYLQRDRCDIISTSGTKIEILNINTIVADEN